VFSINPSTGAEAVVYSFKGGSDGAEPVAGLISVGGTLYGTTAGGGGTGCSNRGCGTVFSVNPATGAEKVVYSFKGGSDGANPEAGLIYLSGSLYGTTEDGGGVSCGSGYDCGTVFSINPSTGAETVVHSFQGNSIDGGEPYASLLNVGGILYGTTSTGGGTGCVGTQGCGTVFSYTP
jgi:uncharacterized repeat protein (TIGR03803 family)